MRRVAFVMLASFAVGVLAASASAAGLPLGPSNHSPEASYQAYYDGHKDRYLVTDVSNKAQASALQRS